MRIPDAAGLELERVYPARTAALPAIHRSQDRVAFESQQRAKFTTAEGRFKDQIVPIEIKTRKGITVFDIDEHVRGDTTMEGLAKLKPAFKKDGGGVTAGNASGLNDGAGAGDEAGTAAGGPAGARPRRGRSQRSVRGAGMRGHA